MDDKPFGSIDDQSHGYLFEQPQDEVVSLVFIGFLHVFHMFSAKRKAWHISTTPSFPAKS